jgi:D-alanine transaminase
MEVHCRRSAGLSYHSVLEQERLIVPETAFINGRFLPLAEATVSIEDRGFQFGDGVYEVIRTYQGRPFKVEAHLGRLERSSQAIGLRQPYSFERWAQYIDEGLRLAAFSEAKIYLQITRGTAPRDHVYADDLEPTVTMTVRDLRPLNPVVQAAGVHAMTMEDIRWGRCDIKSINLLANVLARQQAKQGGVFEAILIRDGHVTEGAVSNVILVRERTLITAPEGAQILSGVTRAVVLDLARREGFAVEERYCSREELLDAGEVFLTGTTVEVLGVVRIDGKPIGGGEPGTVTRSLAKRFHEQTA